MDSPGHNVRYTAGEKDQPGVRPAKRFGSKVFTQDSTSVRGLYDAVAAFGRQERATRENVDDVRYNEDDDG